MDDFTAEMLATGRALDSPEDSHRRRGGHDGDDDKTPVADADSNSPPNLPSGSGTPSQKTGLRGGFAAIRQKASIQDRLVEKYDAGHSELLRCQTLQLTTR
jgi:hypothetical protein